MNLMRILLKITEFLREISFGIPKMLIECNFIHT